MSNPIGQNPQNSYSDITQGHSPQTYTPFVSDSPDYSAPDGQQYPVGAQSYGYPSKAKTNPYAVASLVLAILGSCGIAAIIGIILGVKARKEIASNPSQSGDGLALAGIIVASIQLGVFCIAILFQIIKVLFYPF